MALNAYLTMKGQKQGDIKGSVTEKGRENSILVFAMENGIQSPRDPATGLPSGKRRHQPIVIRKEVDRSSPLLYNALVTNETIVTWQLHFWRSLPIGVMQQYYSVQLTNASIVGINFYLPNTQDPTLMKFTEYEEVSFTYQKIEWIWTDGNITAVNDWAPPV